MGSPCPWCLESTDRDDGASVCSRCGRPLSDDNGRELRPLDLRFDRLKGKQDALFGRFLTVGTIVAAAIGLVVPLAHLGAVALVPLMIVSHLVAVRLFLIRDARRFLGRARRFFSRWLPRLGFLWIGGVGYGFSVIPVAGAAAAAGTFAALTWGVHRYVLWCLEREKNRQPLAVWERILLVFLMVATFALVVAGAILTAALGWSVAQITHWLEG